MNLFTNNSSHESHIFTLTIFLSIYRVFIKYCVFSKNSQNYQSTGCSLDIVFFPRILESLPSLHRQHSTAIGCTKKYKPIGVTVHSHCVESFEGLLQRCRRGRGCSELWRNTLIFPEHPVVLVVSTRKGGGGYKKIVLARLLEKKISFKSERLFSVLKLEDEKHVSRLRLGCMIQPL